MEIISNNPPRYVEDYDFLSTTGIGLPLTIDAAAGDTIEWKEDTVEAYLAAKPSINDPSVMMPAEKVIFFKAHLLQVLQRSREIQDLTPEQKFQWSEFIKSGGFQTVQ